MSDMEKSANVPAVIIFAGANFNHNLRSSRGGEWNIYSVTLKDDNTKDILIRDVPIKRIWCDEENIHIQLKLDAVLYEGTVVSTSQTKFGDEVGVLNPAPPKNQGGIVDNYMLPCDTDSACG